MGICLGFLGLAVTAQKISGLFGCFYFTKISLNHVFVWKMPGMGCGSVPKHGTEIVGIFGDSWAVRDSPEIVVAVVWSLCIKFYFGEYKI